MTELETERLVLRLPRPEDAADLAVAYADPETMRYMGDGSTATQDEVERSIPFWLERWEKNQVGQFSLERREDGQVLGRAGFLIWDTANWETSSFTDAGERAEVELGWMIAREHWGHGYATEAALAARDWGISERGLTRFISLIRPGNERSVRVAEKVGERYERDVEVGGRPTMLYAYET